jgi:hypothetical protein
MPDITDAFDLERRALDYLAGGLSLVPCSHTTKQPAPELLPRDESGKPVWGPYQVEPPTPEVVRGWFSEGCQSVAAVGGKVSGGLAMFDFDQARFYEAWRQQVGSLADGLPVQRTGREGGGFQVWLRCPEPGGNSKLAWVPDETEDSGRRIAIEIKAEGGYAVAPGSLHPTGRRYQAISGDFANIPTVPQALADALLAAARKLDEAPFTRQQMEAREKSAKTSNRHRAESNGETSIIEAYNGRVSIDEALTAYGYAKRGARYVRPGGKTASVTVSDGRSFHHSANDALSDGFWHRPFDVYCALKHGSDCKAAVKAAAEVLGLDQRGTGQAAGGEHTNTRNKRQERNCVLVRAYSPFPIDTLPAVAGEFTTATAEAVWTDPAAVALPLLAALGAAIGTTCRIRIKPDWREYAVLWTGVVCESGTGKTPAQQHVLGPVELAEQLAAAEYAATMKGHDRALLEYEKELAEWKRAKKKSGDPPERPAEPVWRRYIVNDITIESLAEKLSENPRGLLLARDEFAGWLLSFERYASGKSSDLPNWLSMHNAGSVRTDRKTGTKKTIYVPRAFVCVTGGIQPKALRRALGVEGFDCGLAARLLLAMPPRRPRRFSEATIPERVRLRVAETFRQLWQLRHRTDEHDQPDAVDVPLSEEAKERFAQFVNEWGEEQFSTTSGDLAAVWSKLEATCARLALIFHLARYAGGEPVDLDAVNAETVDAAVKLTRWFGNEARRVYAVLGESEDEQAHRELVELIARRGGNVTARDLQQAARSRFPTADDAERALANLAVHGLGDWRVEDHGGGPGRPAAVFTLHTNTQLGFSTTELQLCDSVSGKEESGNGDGQTPREGPGR